MISIPELDMAFAISVSEPSLWAWVALGCSCLLLVCSGLASASEIAFFSLTPQHLAEISEEHRVCDTRILQLREHSDRALATILILNIASRQAKALLPPYLWQDT